MGTYKLIKVKSEMTAMKIMVMGAVVHVLLNQVGLEIQAVLQYDSNVEMV